jgi:hypothetical protein
VVTWSGFTSDHNNSWNEFVLSLVLRSVKNSEISVNNIEDVHELSLVLVDSLNLNVIQSVDWDIISGLFFNPVGELGFVLLFDLDELLLELLVVSIWDQFSQVVNSGDPFINSTECITDELGESWVAAMDPSSWSNSIGLVLELSRIQLIEFTENSLFKKLRVESSNTVNSVGADDSKISHSDFLWPSFFNQGHSTNLFTVSWVFLLQLGQVDVVDQIDELQVSWQESLDKINGPFFKGFWQDGMVGV